MKNKPNKLINKNIKKNLINKTIINNIKDKIFDKNFFEILLSQIVSVVGGLIAGFLLVLYRDKIFLIPGILILIPGFLEMRGNISGSFASRLTSGLFLKVINPNRFKTRIISGNIRAALILTLITSLVLGISAFLFTYLTLRLIYPKIILIPIIAGIITHIIEIPITLVVTFYLFKKGHDPNNVMGPFVTSTGDIISILAILITVYFI